MVTVWEILAAVVAMLIPNVGGFLNGYLVSGPNIVSWYQYLVMPPLSPPNWLFAPVWIVLYCATGLASFLVWRTANQPYTKISRTMLAYAMVVYVVQLVLNWVWTPLFFGWHLLLPAFIEIVVLDAVTLLNAIIFYRVNWFAGAVYAPYLVWLAFASYLNYAFYELNPAYAY